MQALKPDIWHIGYPKCASTFLQRIILPAFTDEFNFIKKSDAIFKSGRFLIKTDDIKNKISNEIHKSK